MAQSLQRLLGVEPGEGRMVAWAAAALFLIEWASAAVSNASDTLFLKRVGVDYLPVVFLANSILLTATTFAAGRLAVRFDSKRLLGGTFGGLALVLLVLWGLVLVEAPAVATTLVIASKQIDVIALLLFWMVVSGLLSSRQGKRLVALMTAGGTVGTILGSFTSGLFGRLFGIPSLLAIAAFTFAIAALLTRPLVRSAMPRLHRSGPRELPQPPPGLRGVWRESSLFRSLMAASFLAGVLGPMLYFEFSVAADLATRTADGEQRLLELYSELRGWINVGVLAVQVAGSAALFRRIGVPAAAALAPAAYLLGFGGLSLRFGLSTAMPAAMGTGVIDHTVYEPAQRILGALLPQRIRAAATSLVQGPAKRAGAALGSVLILIVVAVGEPRQVAIVGLPFALLWLGVALSLWRNYPNLLLEAASVRHSEGTGASEDDSLVRFLDAGTLRTLQASLEGGDRELCNAACGIFADAPPDLAVGPLTKAMAAAPAVNREMLLPTLDRVLADPQFQVAASGDIAANLARVLEEAPDLSGPQRAKILHLLGRVVDGKEVPASIQQLLARIPLDDSPAVQLAARIAALRLGSGPTPQAAFDEAIGAALGSDDEEVRSIALSDLRFELLRSREQDSLWQGRLQMLTSRLRVELPATTALLAQDDDAIDVHAGVRLTRSARDRLQIVDALADLVVTCGESMSSCVPVALAMADDEHAAVRAATLRFIGNAGLEQYAGMLGERLSSRHGVEALAARGALERLGARATDALIHALRHGGVRAREVASDMLREVRVAPEALRPCIDREINQSRELLLLAGALESGGVSQLVLQRIRERVDESMLAALELLSSILEEQRVAHVSRCLGRGWNRRDRAVLLEALESLLPAAERARILPLLEDQGAQPLARAAGQALGRGRPAFEEAVVEVVAARDALTTALLVATMDSCVLIHLVPELDVEASLRILSDKTRKESAMLSPVEKMLHLKTLDLFEGLTTRQLSELARVADEVVVRDKEVIVTEGEFDDGMYFIVDGKVCIAKSGQPVAELSNRDFFGEMSVFDGETRSATATAASEVRMLRLARNDLFEVMEDQPAIGIGICQILVRRVRNLLNERSVAR